MFAIPNNKALYDNMTLNAIPNFPFTNHPTYPKKIGSLVKRIKATPSEWEVVALAEASWDKDQLGRLARASIISGIVPLGRPHLAVLHLRPENSIFDICRQIEEFSDAGCHIAYVSEWPRDIMLRPTEGIVHREEILPEVKGFLGVRGGYVTYEGALFSEETENAANAKLFGDVKTVLETALERGGLTSREIRNIVNILGYGKVHFPEKDYTAPTGFEVPRVSASASPFAREYAQACDLGRIWYAAQESWPVSLRLRELDREALDMLAGIGEQMGMQSAVDALCAGVPAHDIVAGFKH